MSIQRSSSVRPDVTRKYVRNCGKIENSDFKASNGWLEIFRITHCIIFSKVTGESADCPVIEIGAWMKTMLSIIVGYEHENIFNYDEMELFFQALPDKTLCIKSDAFKRWKACQIKTDRAVTCAVT